MRRALAIFLVVLAALVGARTAFAADTSVTAVDLPVGGSRSLAASTVSKPFTLVGVHWRGSGTVYLRTRSLAGRWTRWRPAAPEPEDAPDPGSLEARARAAWRLG